ncbi:MAG: four helix bundle protein [Saprospiraceae bacterium]
MEVKKDFNLEERLIEFSVMILDLVEKLPDNYSTRHLGSQLIRSGTSPSLNYGEAQAAESPKDFSHKMKICLKELRESQICLKILEKKEYLKKSDFEEILTESGELVAIFTKSVKTIDDKQRKI